MNLFGTALGFAGFFKSRDYGSARIDNIPFRLHYSFTSGFLFLATALLGLNDLFGKEIQCQSNSGGASQAIEQYCWVSGTYTVPDSVGLDENTVGIGPYKKCLMPDEKTILECAREDGTCDERNKGSNDVNLGMCAETQSYYQWVPFILMFQGLVFIIPHKIWEIIEEGKMKSITDGVRIGTSIISEDKERKSTIKNISKFIHRQNKSSGHAKYAYGFFFCLVLSLINVIFNFVFLDVVFKSKFRTLGVRWIKEHFSMENRVLRDIFPRMTACVWTDFGSGGAVQYKNYVCIMAANILNEKIFIFLWFWYIILITISLICVLYYSVLLLSSSENVRAFYLQYAVKSSKVRKEITGERRNNESKEESVESYMKKLPRSNFFFLYFLAHNVEYGTLTAILRELALLERSPPAYGHILRSQVSISPSLYTGQLDVQNEKDIELRQRRKFSISSRQNMAGIDEEKEVIV